MCAHCVDEVNAFEQHVATTVSVSRYNHTILRKYVNGFLAKRTHFASLKKVIDAVVLAAAPVWVPLTASRSLERESTMCINAVIQLLKALDANARTPLTASLATGSEEYLQLVTVLDNMGTGEKSISVAGIVWGTALDEARNKTVNVEDMLGNIRDHWEHLTSILRSVSAPANNGARWFDLGPGDGMLQSLIDSEAPGWLFDADDECVILAMQPTTASGFTFNEVHALTRTRIQGRALTTSKSTIRLRGVVVIGTDSGGDLAASTWGADQFGRWWEAVWGTAKVMCAAEFGTIQEATTHAERVVFAFSAVPATVRSPNTTEQQTNTCTVCDRGYPAVTSSIKPPQLGHSGGDADSSS